MSESNTVQEKGKGINPYFDKIFGDWFKNIIALLILVAGIILLFFGLKKNWIGRDFGLELVYLIIGLIIGKWLENGKN